MHELHEQDKATRQRFDLALKGGAWVAQIECQGMIVRALADARLKFIEDQLKVT
jgi:hypothetical protein